MYLIMGVRWLPQRGFIHRFPPYPLSPPSPLCPLFPTPPPSIRTRGLVTVT